MGKRLAVNVNLSVKRINKLKHKLDKAILIKNTMPHNFKVNPTKEWVNFLPLADKCVVNCAICSDICVHNIHQKNLNCFSVLQQMILEKNELKRGIYKGLQKI